MDHESRAKENLRAILARLDGTSAAARLEAAGRMLEAAKTQGVDHHVVDLPVEWQYSIHHVWEGRLLTALAKRHGLKPYRYKRQRRSTLMLKARDSFLRDVFTPEFERMAKALNEHLSEVADRLIEKVLESPSVVEDRSQPSQFEAFTDA